MDKMLEHYSGEMARDKSKLKAEPEMSEEERQLRMMDSYVPGRQKAFEFNTAKKREELRQFMDSDS